VIEFDGRRFQRLRGTREASSKGVVVRRRGRRTFACCRPPRKIHDDFQFTPLGIPGARDHVFGRAVGGPLRGRKPSVCGESKDDTEQAGVVGADIAHSVIVGSACVGGRAEKRAMRSMREC